MPQRLPVVGSDVNDWGSVLNGFLSVSLNSDGTLSSTEVASAGAEMTANKGAVSGYAGLNLSGIVPAAQLGSGTASSSTFLRGDGTWTATPSAPVSSVFTRTGAVTAQSGDYTAAQVTNAADTSSSSTQTFTGSIVAPTLTASLADKGGQVVNVVAYGATGNGTTDDTTAITAAINASPTGSTILFPHGTYLISSPIRMLPHRKYVGVGNPYDENGATIKQKTGSNMTATGGPLTGLFVADAWYANSSTCDYPLTIDSLAFDGNYANNASSTACGIVLMNYNSIIQNCYVANTPLHGICLTDTGQDGTTRISNTAVENRIQLNRIDTTQGHGIAMVSTGTNGGAANTDGFCVDNLIAGAQQDGINFAAAAGWLFRGNHIYGNQGDGLVVSAGYATRVIENYVESFGDANVTGTYYLGIAVGVQAGRGCVVAGNIVGCNEPSINVSHYQYINVSANFGSTDSQAVVSNNLIHCNIAPTSNGIGLVFDNHGGGSQLTVSAVNNIVVNVNTESYASNSVIVSRDIGALSVSGIGSSTASSRYVGATSSGAPASNSYSTGDYIVDQTGVFWVCTAGGSPGTWRQVGGITSFNSRTGAVTPTAGDYTAAQVTNAADTSSSSTQTFTGNVSAPAVVASGLTGATAASRYVGATTSGAPASGTFAVGDYVIDQTARIWICTSAGSPGTWMPAAPSKRVTTLTVSTNTYTPNCSTTDIALISSPTAGFTIAAPTGTPVDGQSLIFRIKSSGSTFTPTWNSTYTATSVTPPTTLVASKTVTVGFIYDATSAAWICLAVEGTGY